MKIVLSVLTINLDLLGGLNFKVSELIRGLVNKGHSVSIIQTPVSAKNSERFFGSLSGKVKCISLDNIKIPKGYARWLYYPIMWQLASKEIIKEGGDVFDLWDPLIGIDGSVGCGYKTIFSHNHFAPHIQIALRNCGWRTLPMFFEIPYLEKMIRLYQTKIDGFIVENRFQKDLLLNSYGVVEDAIGLVPSGYDQKLIDKYQVSSRRYNHDRKFLVFSGRIHRWKGVNELISAFAMLAKEYSDWDLQVVGDGPELDKIKQRVNELNLIDRVIFWGERNYVDTIKLVSKGDIFVFPSYIEGFSLSALEALALGIPVVTTDIVADVNGLIKDGYSGLTVPIKNIDRLYSCIRRLIVDPELRNYLSINGKNMAKGYSFEAMVEKTLSFYKQLT